MPQFRTPNPPPEMKWWVVVMYTWRAYSIVQAINREDALKAAGIRQLELGMDAVIGPLSEKPQVS